MQQRDAPVALAHQRVTERVRHGQRSQRADRVGKQRVRAVERVDVAQPVRQVGPASGLDRAADLERQLVERDLPLARVGAALAHQAQQVAVRGDVVEPVVVHADVADMAGHVLHRGAAADLENRRVARGVELQDGRAELEALRPLGPAARRVAAVDREDRRATRRIPRLLEPRDLLRGQLEQMVDGAEERGGREPAVDTNHWVVYKPPDVKTAVEVNHVAGREREVTGEHGAHGLADVLGGAPAPLWHESLGDQRVVLVLDARGHVGRHDAGSEFQDLHTLGRQAHGPELRGHRQARLRDAVFTAVDRRRVGGDRGDEDDLEAARQRRGVGLREPVVGDGLREEERALQVDAQQFLERRLARLGQVGADAWGHAGVVDQRIDPTEGGERLRDHRGAVVATADVALHRHEALRVVRRGASAEIDGLVSGRGIAGVVDRDRQAFGRCLDRDASTEPTARASDQHHRNGCHRGALYSRGRCQRTKGQTGQKVKGQNRRTKSEDLKS